jgi:hypothetical protein
MPLMLRLQAKDQATPAMMPPRKRSLTLPAGGMLKKNATASLTRSA